MHLRSVTGFVGFFFPDFSRGFFLALRILSIDIFTNIPIGCFERIVCAIERYLPISLRETPINVATFSEYTLAFSIKQYVNATATYKLSLSLLLPFALSGEMLISSEIARKILSSVL